jgi:hypothetical protein
VDEELVVVGDQIDWFTFVDRDLIDQYLVDVFVVGVVLSVGLDYVAETDL